MNAKRKKIVAVFVVVVVFLGLMVVVLRGSPANYWITPGELGGQGGAGGQQVRVAGTVVNNSLNWDRARNRMVFKIKAEGEKVVLPVAYAGIPADGLITGSRVIVEGSLQGGEFNASTVLVRCPENYLPEKAVTTVFRGLKIEGALFR